MDLEVLGYIAEKMWRAVMTEIQGCRHALVGFTNSEIGQASEDIQTSS